MKIKKITVMESDLKSVLSEIDDSALEAFKVYKNVSKKLMPLSRHMFLANMCLLFDEYAAEHNDESLRLAADAISAISSSPVMDGPMFEVSEDEEDEENDE